MKVWSGFNETAMLGHGWLIYYIPVFYVDVIIYQCRNTDACSMNWCYSALGMSCGGWLMNSIRPSDAYMRQ